MSAEEKDLSKTPIVTAGLAELMDDAMHELAFLQADLLAMSLVRGTADPRVIFSVAAGFEAAVARMVSHMAADHASADMLLDGLHEPTRNVVHDVVRKRGPVPQDRLDRAKKWGVG